ncbi:transcription factor SPT20 [Microdochium nivale]|nr:transcription factor SPT20 [Microdochium nivale]
MAPVVAAAAPAATPAVASKAKRPIPSSIQTNGAITAAQSSPSPLMSAKKAPTAAAKAQQQAANGIATNGTNNTSRLSISKVRRDTSISVARGQRNATTKAGQAVERTMSTPLSRRTSHLTHDYILKKYRGSPPSLVVHLHDRHFKFENQEGIFGYKTPMKIFLEHVRSKTVPHDLLPYFNDWGVVFYEACLIVQVHNHKSVAPAKDAARPVIKSETAAPCSIHNYNPYITPSPWVPYPKDNSATAETNAPSKDEAAAPADGSAEKIEGSSGSESTKSKQPAKSSVFTVVLFPTPQTIHADLMITALTPHGAVDGKTNGESSTVPPQTPITAVPPTPTGGSMPPPNKKQKRDKASLDSRNIYAAEGQILLATAAPLDLEPTKSKEALIVLLDKMAKQTQFEQQPQPKARKRTVAERAADEAIAADQEKYMLTYDERLSSTASGSQGAADGGDAGGQSGAAAFDASFARFKVINDIKRDHAEKKEQEKVRQAENERKLQAAKVAQQQQEAAALLQQQQQRLAEEKAQRELQLQQQRQAQLLAQQQVAQRRAAAQNQAQSQTQGQAAHSPPNANHMPGPHGHPNQGGMANGGIPGQVAAHRFPQQVSQPPVSSPVVRQGTPQNMSSPMVGNVAMQQTNSGMGGSPARPPSVVQAQTMGVPMAPSMSARGSQQSHPSGTPRMPNSTPQMAHGTPINRPMPTPRMSQASPPPGMMAGNSQMGQNMMNMQNMGQNMNQQQMMAAQMAAHQQRARIAAQQQQMALANAGMMNGQNPQMHNQQQMLQMMQRQQMLNNMQNGNGGNNMNNMMAAQQAQIAARYQQQLQAQQQQQQHAQAQAQMSPMQGGQQMGGQNFMGMNGGMNPQQQMAALQQLQLQQQQQQQAQQQQQQQQQQNPQNALQIQVRQKSQALFQQNMPSLAQKYGGVNQIPADVMENFKRQCQQKAREMLQQQLFQRQMQMQQQQQQQQQNMGGMMQQGM